MVVDNKAKTESTVLNDRKTDALRPLGRAPSKEVDTIHHEEKKEISGASSSTISETTRHVKEEADNDFFKERRKVVDLDGSIISDLAIHEDPWEETYPCEKRKKIINKDISTASGLANREDLWEKHMRLEADNYTREESINIIDSDEKEEIMFRPRKDPKEAVKEDLFRFLQKNYDNLVSWPDGRSGWAPSQVTAGAPNTIYHWGDPGSPPSLSTANMNFTTKWAPGFEGNYLDNTGIVLHLGYLEAAYIDLKEREFGSGKFLGERPIFMKHSYEISLLAP